MPQAASRATTFPVTVVYKERAVTVNGASNRVEQIIPEVAGRLGASDSSVMHNGYDLIDSRGRTLSSWKTLPEQGVARGGTLKLALRSDNEALTVFDDVVEAVGVSVNKASRAWTENNTLATALIVSCALLATGALCFLTFSPTILNAALCYGFGIVIMSLSVALERRNMASQALWVAMASCLFGGIAGYQLGAALYPAANAYAQPLLFAALSCALFGCVGLACSHEQRWKAAAPLMLGVLLAIGALLTIAMRAYVVRIWTVFGAAVALAVNILPWACLSVARISVQSPHAQDEIFGLPPTFDAKETLAKYLTGSDLLFCSRVAVCVALLVAVPAISANESPLGIVLCIVAYAAILLDSRQIHSLPEMATTAAGCGVGLIAALAVGIATHPSLAVPIAIGLLLAALAALAATAFSNLHALAVTRAADACETACTVLIPVVAYLAATA